MGSAFLVYFRLGVTHIADWQAYDHILFITALTAGYGLRDWRRLLWLVTAFTLGHTSTLALATLGWVRISSHLVEVLIPVTIVATAAYGLRIEHSGRHDPARAPAAADRDVTSEHILYGMAAVFGLIHGLGFSTFLRAVLGAEERIVLPLFAFNLGLEFGQLAIVVALLVLGALVTRGLRMPARYWLHTLSMVAIVLGLVMIVQRLGEA
jgi:hypothetical protein